MQLRVLAVLMAFTVIAAAPAKPPPVNEVAAAQSRAIAAEAEALELTRRNLILEAANEIEDKAYSRFEIGMGGLGLLITLLVIVFGFRTEKAAARAASAEIADRKSEIDELLKVANSAARSAEASANSAATHEGKAATSAAHAEESSRLVADAAALATRFSSGRSGEETPALTEDQRTTVVEGAREAQKQREAELTVDEFKARIAKARFVDKNPEEVVRLARGLAFVHAQNDEAVSFSMFQEAISLQDLERHEEAVRVYDTLEQRFAGSSDSEIGRRVQIGRFNKAVSLGAMRKNQEAIAIYDNLHKETIDKEHRDLREVSVSSLYNKACRLADEGDAAGEMEAYDQVITSFIDDTDPAVCSTVARAIINRGINQSAAGDHDQALVSYDLLLSRFPPGKDSHVNEEVADALVNKGGILGQRGELDDAAALFRETIERFEGIDAEEVKTIVDRAYFNLGLTEYNRGNLPSARENYERAVSRDLVSASEDARADRSKALLNLAGLYALDGNVPKTIALLDSWAGWNGGFDVETVAQDVDFQPILGDEVFKAYLASQATAEP